MSAPKRPQRPVRPKRPGATPAHVSEATRAENTNRAIGEKRDQQLRPQRTLGNRRKVKAPSKGSAEPAKAAETAKPEARQPHAGSDKAPGSAKPASTAPSATSPRATTSAKPAKPGKARGSVSPNKGPVVHAGERFARRVRKKPWQKGRRWLPITVGFFFALVALAVLALAFLPQLKVSHVRLAGVSYVDVTELEQVASASKGQALAFADLGALEDDLSAVPGVKSAKATRQWPSTIRVVVTERTAIAQLESRGGTAIVDGTGQALPAAAANPTSLPHLVVEPTAANVEATESTLLEITRVLPPNLRAALTKATASSPSSVTLEVATDAGPRTVVWGGAEDSELKAKVLEALLSQPGAVIDVSSPEAPTIR